MDMKKVPGLGLESPVLGPGLGLESLLTYLVVSSPLMIYLTIIVTIS